MKNTLLEKLNSGKQTVGAFAGQPSPALVEMMGWLNFDFVIIDCEHGPIDYETAEHMIRAAELSGITPTVRIGLNEQQHIQRYLEAGAQGVLIPLINTKEDAQKVVDAVRYPPVGKRGGYTGRSAQLSTDMAAYVREMNEEIMIGLQIETPEAIENQDDIINTEEADLIFLGPGDLSLNFGIPGQIAAPKVVDTITELTKKIRAAGKHAGTITANGEAAKMYADAGINWHVSATTGFFRSGAQSYYDDVWANLPN